jgi:hypothetical protein
MPALIFMNGRAHRESIAGNRAPSHPFPQFGIATYFSYRRFMVPVLEESGSSQRAAALTEEKLHGGIVVEQRKTGICIDDCFFSHAVGLSIAFMSKAQGHQERSECAPCY